MHRFLHNFARMVSSSKGSKIVVSVWILAIILLSVLAPSSKDVEENAGEGSAYENKPSEIAHEVMENQYPSDNGLVALLVYNHKDGISDKQKKSIKEMSEWLDSDDKPDNVASAMPFHKMPEEVQGNIFSDDKSTTHINVSMEKDLESDELYDTLGEIKDKADELDDSGMTMKITGPAGIAADTVSMFKNADLVLMLSTIGLILVLLMLIYRSPLLATIPLIVAGLVYSVTDRVLGIGGDKSWFVVESQATSIMMILLFAVLTDYSLFVLARYRQELRKYKSKNEAMAHAFEPVLKPILFSGVTLLAAMLVLFLTDFKPYNHFAPVFSVAIVFILLGGITLIPAIFALAGRKAFWPIVPKVEENIDNSNKRGFWSKVGNTVTKKPGITAGVIVLLMLVASFNLGSMKFSFNQLESFPEDIDARQGYEMMAEHFPEGDLAPTNIILESDNEFELDEDFINKLDALRSAIEDDDGIEEASPTLEADMVDSDDELPKDFLSDSEKAVKFDVTLDGNPYSQSALDVIEKVRDNEKTLLEDNGLDSDSISLHVEGQSAEQLDVREMNKKDMIVAFSVITVLITIMLMLQSGSIIMGLVMIFTMLISYTASLGLGWFLFNNLLGYDAISYRLPLYTFVFLISLGVDYNIILVSRIREEIHHYHWKEAISRGVELTGGVISSAGIILAGTFTVLMTQPLQELFLFGMTMGMGILIDTFIVRGMLLPSLLTFTKPKQAKHTVVKSDRNKL